jgi:octaprenyl-diphosphate synthase
MDAALAGEGPLVEAARWLRARGGKRVRARMALGAARAVGGDPARALAAAAGVEWVHAASLVLDDIVDEAELRRGAAALHRATSTPFAAGVAGWLLVRTLLADRGDAGVDGLGETLLALAEGQRAELARAGDLAMSLDEWYGIATAKTARLFAHAATVGGAAVGATPAQQRALARYGEQIGLAFQIVDDLLDFVGDEGTLGKRPGQDLRAGRVTFPLLLLRDIAPALLASPSPDAIRAGLVRFGVPELCLARARAHRDRAVAALERLPGDPAELVALAHLCVERSA